ncbi:hypothetical protein J3U09_03235 [Gilliamella sp. B2889]|uniref:hypothetical protein n=1 Tax=Gilliamella sp. B2889 TaxID=2817985 RepID=UPI002269F337|nr:hypothetical protein [Gilliamella sp. B2889]MCX8682732.1 hypothetical protein [Gilliamella sp. B2889]
MHQPSEFADKLGVPAFNFKIINFFLSIKIVLPFYTIPFFIFGLYVVLFGEVGGIFPAFFGVKGCSAVVSMVSPSSSICTVVSVS